MVRLMIRPRTGRSRMRPEDVIADKRRPFTGAEYIESLRDGREVYIDGERVADVTTHPAFRNSVRSIARLYDALHDPKRQRGADLPDRYRIRRLHPQIFPRATIPRGPDRRARRHRRMVSAVLWLDGPHAGLQGRLHQHAWRQRRILRTLRRQCPSLVQAEHRKPCRS